MLSSKFSEQEIKLITKSSITGYEFTGAGYLLELTNKILPTERFVVSEPIIVGIASLCEVGFILFLENHKLTIECHSWGIDNPPDTIRTDFMEIFLSTENKLQMNGIYKVPDIEYVHLVELEVLDELNDFDISKITQVITNQERLNWQAPYTEKYLNKNNYVIGDLFDEPETLLQGDKILFFFHGIQHDKPFRTQFGVLGFNKATEIPPTLRNIMKYEHP